MEVEIAVVVDGWGAVAHHVAAGAGVAIVPDACLDGATTVHTVRLNGALPPRRYVVLTRRRRALSLPARRFLDVVAAGAGGA